MDVITDQDHDNYNAVEDEDLDYGEKEEEEEDGDQKLCEVVVSSTSPLPAAVSDSSSAPVVSFVTEEETNNNNNNKSVGFSLHLDQDAFPSLSAGTRDRDQAMNGLSSISSPVPALTPLISSWADMAAKNKNTTATATTTISPIRNKSKPAATISDSEGSRPTKEMGQSHFQGNGSMPSTVNTTATSTSTTPSQPSRILTGVSSSNYGSTAASSARIAAEDDGLNWVNVDNIHSHRAAGSGVLGSATMSCHPVNTRMVVACVTTDFTMQNVLLQMNLGLSSVEGMAVRSIRQWILRCGACLKVHYDMERLFCSKCGSNLMQRIAASVDAKTGELRLHLRKNFQPNTRGLRYSLPKPGQQSRFEGELLLREDQLQGGIWRQKVVKVQKDVNSAFGEDITGDLGVHINKSSAIKFGLGKQNPNARKGRERRGKKK
eukprot:gene12946-27315_t